MKFLIVLIFFFRVFIRWKRIRVLSSSQERTDLGIFLRKGFQKLGPAFIKLGQMLSMRFDLLPKEICFELQELLDNNPPFSPQRAREILSSELEQPIERVFSSFEEKPISAASIGQVHRAKLKDGSPVAVKVRRPGITKTIIKDLKIIRRVVVLGKKVPMLEVMRIDKIYEEFKDWTLKEISYENELSNMQRFRRKYKDNKTINSPRVYPEYSTDKVLVAELIQGVTLKKAMKDQGEGPDMENVLEQLIKIISIENFETGLIHADPHPANIIIDEDGSLYFVDFGVIKGISQNILKKIKKLFLAIDSGDVEKMIEICLSVDETLGNEKVEGLREKMRGFVLNRANLPIEDLSFTSFVSELLYIGAQNGIEWPSDLVLLIRQFITLDGIALKLKPEMDIFAEFYPYLERSMVKDIISSTSQKKIKKDVLEMVQKAIEFPELILRLIESTEKLVERMED